MMQSIVSLLLAVESLRELRHAIRELGCTILGYRQHSLRVHHTTVRLRESVTALFLDEPVMVMQVSQRLVTRDCPVNQKI